MSRRAWFPVLLSACVCCAAAAAQRPSHTFDDSDTVDPVLLAARLGQTADRGEVDEVVDLIRKHPELLKVDRETADKVRDKLEHNPQLRQELREFVEKKFQDPAFRKEVLDAAREHRLQDREIDAFRGTLRLPDQPPRSNPGSTGDPSGTQDKRTPPDHTPITKQPPDKGSTGDPQVPRQGATGRDRQPSGGRDNPSRRSEADAPDRKAGEAAEDDWRRRGARRMTEWLSGQEGNDLRNSPVVRNMVGRLVDAARLGGRGTPVGAGLDRLPSLGRSLVPGALKGRSPALPGGASVPPAPSLGGPRTPSVPGGPSGAGGALLWAAALGVVALLAWRALARARRAGRDEPQWQLGPWPVRPEDVASRGDLVRAFEYLACLLLGPKALTRHHLELAAELGDTAGTERRAAARRLAGLYEQARYAPPAEPLADAELADARHDLAALAGVARA